jgi:hypothetical protein
MKLVDVIWLKTPLQKLSLVGASRRWNSSQLSFHKKRDSIMLYQPTDKKKLRAEYSAGARRRPLLGPTIPGHEAHCWKWQTVRQAVTPGGRLALTGFLSCRKAPTFQTRGYCCCGTASVKDGFLGAEPRSVGIALADGLCDLRGGRRRGGGGVRSLVSDHCALCTVRNTALIWSLP